MKQFKDLTPDEQAKYGELCFNYMSELAEQDIDINWDVDLKTISPDTTVNIKIDYSYTSSGKRNFDPRLHTYKTKVEAVLQYEDLKKPGVFLPIEFIHNFELNY